MKFERRFIMVFLGCILFIGFWMTPIGENFYREVGGMNNGRSNLEWMNYYSKRDFSGAKNAREFQEIFKDQEILERTEFFYKEEGIDNTLRSGIALYSEEDDMVLTDAYLKTVVNIGYEEVFNNHSKKDFQTYQFKIGREKDLYSRIELSGETQELVVKDTYDTETAYHQIAGVNKDLLKDELIEELPFLYDIYISKLVLSPNHVIVKTIVNEDLNFSKKEGLEKKLKERLDIDHLSIVYTHRGEILDKTIDESDPQVDRLYLNLSEVQSYYTKDQIEHYLEK